MEKIELGIYHYKTIVSIVNILENFRNPKNNLIYCFDIINNAINSNFSMLLMTENNSLSVFLTNGIEKDKLKDIQWEEDEIVLKTLEYKIPLKIDSLINDKIFKNINFILTGLGYKFDSILSIPLSYNKNIYGILILCNKNKQFTMHEFEMLKIIANQISYQLEINNLKESSENKCIYLLIILDNISSAIIIYSENTIKFINKKAKEILEDNINNNELISLIKDLYISKKSLSRQELAIKIKDKNKIIGFSSNYIKANEENILIFIFQDITRFAFKN